MTTERLIDVTTEDLQRAIHSADKIPHTFDEAVAYAVLKLGFVALGGRRVRLKLPNGRHLLVGLEDEPALPVKTVDKPADGWNRWDGSSFVNPIPNASCFQVRYRNGKESEQLTQSFALVWHARGVDSDIVAYKVIE